MPTDSRVIRTNLVISKSTTMAENSVSVSSPITNPYYILGLSRSADKQEIVRAQMSALKQKRYSPQAIGEAQKSLLDPQKRLIADLLFPVLPAVTKFRREKLTSQTIPVPETLLEILPEFDSLAAELANIYVPEKDVVDEQSVLTEELQLLIKLSE